MSIPDGPSAETLRTLANLLPGLKKGLKDGSLKGKGKTSKPRRMCRACGVLWDFINVPVGSDTKIIGDHCAACADKLKAGWTALTWSDQIVWVEFKEPEQADLRGTIQPVTEHTLKTYQKEFKRCEEQKEKQKISRNGHHD